MDESVCTCGRPYYIEAVGDRGLCCICERDARMIAVLGARWRRALLARLDSL